MFRLVDITRVSLDLGVDLQQVQAGNSTAMQQVTLEVAVKKFRNWANWGI
jgi:hypothetical protein